MRTRMQACVVVTVLVGVLVSAQSGPRILTGTIKDTSGAVLPGVSVTVTGPERRVVVTDAQGRFTLTNLLPGKYEIRCELAGFVTVTARKTMGATGTERVDLTMQVGSVTETITVSSATPRMETSVSRQVMGLFGGRAKAAPGQGVYDPPARSGGHFNTEAYDHVDENSFHRVATDPLSTFSIDVDTASYANVRRFLTDGARPPAGAVRIEEMVNYFRFAYTPPAGDAPFSITTELTPAPWNPKHQLALIGLQGRALPERDETPRNLVFLIDVSGSMMDENKLPLVRNALHMLTNVLGERDRVAMVVYAGSSGLVLPSTTGDRKNEIHRAIANLEAFGSTNGAAGIQLAYAVARTHFVRGGVNRVILATDGDFNVGVTNQDELIRLIERERASGVFLSVLGVGTGNLKDSTMEKLADKGNGNYNYLDSVHEARKVLVREGGSTLTTIAKDVKIQVEFNPRTVAGYRLIGYENRILQKEDFNDDAKDAGEIGAGHSVTALYEIVPAGEAVDAGSVDPLKYQRGPQPARAGFENELATVHIRYKAPHGDKSTLMSSVVLNRPQSLTANIGFASAVAEFGMLLQNSKHMKHASYGAVLSRARDFKGDDRDGDRAEFVRLVELASALRP